MPRTTIAALLTLLALVAALAAPAASVAGAGAAPKVVVIVGPVGAMTASYQADADAAAAAALQYTPNVVKVYTPNATWEAVKAALQGASIVIYMGHGNGFPSPYRTTPWPLSQNGLGLNPVAGGDNTTTRYYGESYLASEIRLAPNAAVFLHHLCYASGNSEPGRGEPTLAVAQQRIDNYGAGWLQAGARAVLADAHFGAAYYVNALFTTSQTIDAVWRGAPGAQGNYLAFPSSRTPGALGQLDPETPTSGFYRSLIGDPTLSTTSITGGAGATGVLSGTTSSGDPAVPAADPTAVDPALGGATSPALPLDTIPPLAVPASPTGLTAATFSPNGDGIADRLSTDVVTNEAGVIEVTVSQPAGAPVRSFTVPAAAGRVRVIWDGRTDAGVIAPDGPYTLSLTPRDAAGNVGPTLARPVAVYAAVTVLPASSNPFFPHDPNGTAPATTTLGFTLAAPATVTWTISDRTGRTVTTRYLAVPLVPGAHTFTWDGRDAAGNVVAPGTYYSNINAGNGSLALRTRAAFTVGAFAISVSDTTPARGQTIAISVISAEPLVASPRLVIAQPGTTARVVTMSPSGSGYRATIMLRRTTRTGSLVLAVSATDLAGVTNRSRLVLPLH
ncbi:MAG: FlgD immunoglobulin-like domain containing protein [Chloroflexota bacterium]